MRGTIEMDDYNTSDAIVMSPGNIGAFQASWDTGVGNLVLQESIDREHWTIVQQVDIDGYLYDSYSIVAPGHYYCEIRDITAPFMRVKYNIAHGSGTLSFIFHQKRRA